MKKSFPQLCGLNAHKCTGFAENVASPYFVGHMTSAIPFFMVHLKAITAALNQNLIKLETSKVLSLLEKQVLAKIHRQIYRNDKHFYEKYVQNTETTLGVFTTGGTTANLTALWVASNSLFPPKEDFGGIEHAGFFEAMVAYDTDRVVVLVSKRGHYSLKKALYHAPDSAFDLVTVTTRLFYAQSS